MKIINDLLKILSLEMTELEFIALILSVSTVGGIFKACYRTAKEAEEFYKEKTENEVYIFSGEPGAGMSRHAVLPNQSEKEREADERVLQTNSQEERPKARKNNVVRKTFDKS